MALSRRLIAIAILTLFFPANNIAAAERFYISIPGPTLSYVPLYYGQEKGFFSQEGLDLQVLVVRGIVGVSSLMSGEIDVTCHAGSGFSAALRGVPVKVISVTRDRPIHELIVGPAANSPAELKGKSIAVGSLDGTAAVMTRRILQAKGLDAQKDVQLLRMDTPARLQSLLSGRVAGEHGRMHRQKYFDKGQPCPVVACFGVDPLLHMIATRPEPYGRSEFDAVGGIKGETVEVIRGEFTGLPIPAYAEIAIAPSDSRHL